MCIKRHFITIILSVIGIVSIYAQQERAEICIDFRQNSHTIDSTYMDNAVRLSEIMELFGQLHNDRTLSIVQVTFSGVASPEGNSQINKRLAANRLAALEDYVRSHITLQDSLVIHHDDQYIPWQYLIAEVEASDIDHKEEVLSILRSPKEYVPYYNGTTIDSRVPALQKLDGGSVWRTLNSRFFAKMRNACAVFITIKKEPLPVPVSTPADTTAVMATPYVHPQPTPSVPLQEPEVWTHRLYLKTNAIGLAMGIANLAIEADVTSHWSFALPVYYSAWDYFKTTIKFRTFAIQPEVRYWLSEDNNGFFGGAHFGLAYYNFAFDGDYRYQDHNRKTPAIGGGVSAGYRMPISKNKRWQVEFSLGAGVYPLHYDKFHNTPVTKDGLMTASIQKTYFGIDQAAVSLAYTLGLKKKKGGKR